MFRTGCNPLGVQLLRRGIATCNEQSVLSKHCNCIEDEIHVVYNRKRYEELRKQLIPKDSDGHYWTLSKLCNVNDSKIINDFVMFLKHVYSMRGV